eukprot:10022717-Ditylum_brightwellii.AAC.1
MQLKLYKCSSTKEQQEEILQLSVSISKNKTSTTSLKRKAQQDVFKCNTTFHPEERMVLLVLSNQKRTMIDFKNVVIQSLGRTDQLVRDDIKLNKRMKNDKHWFNASLNAKPASGNHRVKFKANDSKALIPLGFTCRHFGKQFFQVKIGSKGISASQLPSVETGAVYTKCIPRSRLS